jgi:hypothetical protein
MKPNSIRRLEGGGAYQLLSSTAKSCRRAIASMQATTELEGMKIRRLMTLMVGITSVALSPMTSAAGHGGGGGRGANQTKAAASDTEQEQALLYSGFEVKSASTARQRAQVRALSSTEFTALKQNGNPYYLYPDKRNNRLYAGDQYAYRAYQRYVKDKQLRAEGVFVRPIRYENKSDPRNVEIWQEWGPFPAWKYQSSR